MLIQNTFPSSHRFIKKGEKLHLLLDFDGTLAPIQPNPILTTIDPDSERLMHLLARNPNIFIAIISGRRSPDVKHRVGIENITYSGNHGLEIIFANQTNYLYPVGDELLTNATHLRKALAKVGRTIEAVVNLIGDRNIRIFKRPMEQLIRMIKPIIYI